MEITKDSIIIFFSKPYNKIKFYEYYLASTKEEGCYYQYTCHVMQNYITKIFATSDFTVCSKAMIYYYEEKYAILLEELLPELFAHKYPKTRNTWFLGQTDRLEAIKKCLKVLKDKENQKKELQIIRTIIIISAIAIIYLLYKTIS